MNFERYLDDRGRLIERHLERVLPPAKRYPSLLHQAMRYSVLGGGKRIRSILVLASAEACSPRWREALLPACAIELFHTYSLIHDDLPCLDNDEFRRGKLTCHRKFGEPYALLAGDALLTLGFQILSQGPHPKLVQRLVHEVGEAIGSQGMIGGQVVDKISETEDISLPVLDYIHVNKTGKLIKVSCLVGALVGGATAAREKALARFGEYLGLAFQVVDDIMDSDGYMRFMTEAQAREKARELTARAKKSLQIFGGKGEPLGKLAEYVLNRKK